MRNQGIKKRRKQGLEFKMKVRQGKKKKRKNRVKRKHETHLPKTDKIKK